MRKDKLFIMIVATVVLAAMLLYYRTLGPGESGGSKEGIEPTAIDSAVSSSTEAEPESRDSSNRESQVRGDEVRSSETSQESESPPQTARVQITAQTVTPAIISEAFRSSGFYDVSYTEAKDTFGEADIPLLIDLLEDPDYAYSWGHIGQTIGYVGRDSAFSKQAGAALVNFYQRTDDWGSMTDDQRLGEARAKWKSLRHAGFTADMDTLEYLKTVFTSGKIEAGSAEWIGDSFPASAGGSHTVSELARGEAAVGLVLSRDKAAVDLVLAYHKVLDAEMRRKKSASTFYHVLGEAVAIDRVINEKGFEFFVQSHSLNETAALLVMRYMGDTIWHNE